MGLGASSRRTSAHWAVLIGLTWFVLLLIAAFGHGWLDNKWPHWQTGFWALGVWGVIVLLLRYAVGGPFSVSRIPALSTAFALLMSLFGSGSYWATLQVYPRYHVEIEEAAFFVAVCTAFSLVACAFVSRLLARQSPAAARAFAWEWPRLRLATYVLFGLAAVGTVVAIRKIGYVPVLRGDPAALRVDFPTIGGVWYRLSMLGVVVALLVSVQACARRADVALWAAGIASLGMVGLYGPRFFVVLPVGVILLLWDRFRARISARLVIATIVFGIPAIGLVFFVRLRTEGPAAALGPLSLALYGSLGEFRDLAWALEHYSEPGRFLHGGTLGSLVVPLLPSVAWSIVGIDKDAVFAQNSATILADQMGRVTGQRIGVYGELFMNFGWEGALVGALLYGALLGFLDRRFEATQEPGAVGSIVVAVAAATTVFAQIGQLNMFTSTFTAFGYPLLLLALIAARRAQLTN